MMALCQMSNVGAKRVAAVEETENLQGVARRAARRFVVEASDL
jgi:hypothetical protein